MKTKVLKEIYLSLLESGDLYEFLPGAQGNWTEDKKTFIEIQEGLNICLEDSEENKYFLEEFHHKEMNILFGVDEDDEDIDDQEDYF